jgi:hypothetical protein
MAKICSLFALSVKLNNAELTALIYDGGINFPLRFRKVGQLLDYALDLLEILLYQLALLHGLHEHLREVPLFDSQVQKFLLIIWIGHFHQS